MNLDTAASITYPADRLTSLERVLAVLQHREPDRVPHFEWVIDKGVIAALTNGGSYWDLVEFLDIDAVMVAPAYRKQTIEAGLVLDEWASVRTIGHDDYALVVEDRVPIKSEADLAHWQVPDPDDTRGSIPSYTASWWRRSTATAATRWRRDDTVEGERLKVKG
jgi:hypothetical protein